MTLDELHPFIYVLSLVHSSLIILTIILKCNFPIVQSLKFKVQSYSVIVSNYFVFPWRLGINNTEREINNAERGKTNEKIVTRNASFFRDLDMVRPGTMFCLYVQNDLLW